MKNRPTRGPGGMLLRVAMGLLSVAPIFVVWHRLQSRRISFCLEA